MAVDLGEIYNVQIVEFDLKLRKLILGYWLILWSLIKRSVVQIQKCH
jgi:hypothetical protein